MGHFIKQIYFGYLRECLLYSDGHENRCFTHIKQYVTHTQCKKGLVFTNDKPKHLS